MARLNERRSHMVFMDSRGEGLQVQIDCLNKGEYMGIKIYKGATLHQLAKKSQ